MPLKLTGGSLTLSAALLVVAWTIRTFRDKQRGRKAPSAPTLGSSSSKYFAELSLEALALLVHLEAVPVCIMDVRSAEEAAGAPLAPWLTPCINIPEANNLSAALTNPSLWRNTASAAAAAAAAVGGPSVVPDPPSKQHLLVLVSADAAQQQSAVGKAAAAGFDRVAVPSCEITQLLQDQSQTSTSSSSKQQPPAAVTAAAAALHVPAIHTDALAVLLGLVPLPDEVWQLLGHQLPLNNSSSSSQQQQQQGWARSPRHSRNNSSSSISALGGGGGGPEGQQVVEAAAAAAAAAERQQRLLLLDVRRHDERALYGSILGAHHVPVDELASALRLPAGDFRCRYHFEPPEHDLDVLVLHSRANSRALWGVQLACDAGCKRVFVFPDGVMGWTLGTGVQQYDAYQQCQPPPEPHEAHHALTEPDVAAGVMEVQQLGLVGVLMQQHGVAGSKSHPLHSR